jgi:hypothetical protein
MTREEIYEHLARVYLGKRKNNKKNNNLAKIFLLVNLLAVLLLPSFYIIKNSKNQLKIRQSPQKQSFALALNYYPLRLVYNFQDNSPQIENLSLYFPDLNVENYESLVFSIRGAKNSSPRILKIYLENKKREKSTYYFDGITTKWQKIIIPLSEFNQITDWSNISRLSFIIEAWNTDDEKGSVIIDDVCFYSNSKGDGYK